MAADHIVNWRRRRRLIAAHAREVCELVRALADGLPSDSPAQRVMRDLALTVDAMADAARADSWLAVGERFATAAERRKYGATHVRYYNATIPEVNDGR